MAAAKTTTDQPAAGDASAEDLAARVAELEAENTALKAQALGTGATRLVWVVSYPQISVQPRGGDGEPVGEPVVLKQGEVLPESCVWQADFLKSVGYVGALSVPA